MELSIPTNQTNCKQIAERSVLNNPAPDTEGKKQFWQVDIDELKTLYSKGMLTAPGYVYGIVKCLRKDGWWLKFESKEFCKLYNISKTSLYRAITSLASDKDLDFEWSAKEVRVRFGAPTTVIPIFETTANEITEKTPVSIENSSPHSQQGGLVPHLGLDSQMWENFPKSGTVFPNVGQATPGIRSTTESGHSTYSYRYMTNTQSYQGLTETKVSEDEEVIQNPNNPVNQNREPVKNPKPVVKAKNCAAPRENHSQKLTFSGNPLEEPEFLVYYKSCQKAMKGADIKSPAKYVAACLDKEDEGAIEVKALFEEWERHCRALQRKISDYAENPDVIKKQKERFDFENWETCKHVGQLSVLQSLGLKKFCENNEVSTRWYEWASAKYPEKFVDIRD